MLIILTFEIAQQILKCLEIVHHAGFVYNDLKPDNIMITLDDANKINVTLIDYGFLTKFQDKNSNHIKENEPANEFLGNLITASLNKLQFN